MPLMQDELDDHPRRLQLTVWWKVLRLAGGYRWHGAGLAVMALSIAAADVSLPYLTGRIVDTVTSNESGGSFAEYAAAYVAAVCWLCISVFGFILLAGRIAGGVGHDIRQVCFVRLQELEFAYFDRRPVGWIMARLTSDCDRLSRIIGWSLLDFLWAGTVVVAIAGMMFWLNVKLAAIVLTVVPPLLGISIYFQRKLLVTARLVRKANAELTGNYNEAIMGVRTTKALVREHEVLQEFESASQRMFQHSVRNAMQSAVYVPLVISLGTAMTGLALWFGGVQVLTAGMSIGTLVTFMNYIGLFFEPVQAMARQLTDVQMAQAAAERIVGLIETKPAIRDSDEVRAALAEDPAALSESLSTSRGEDSKISSIEFRNVQFGYSSERSILEGFHLTVAAGETIALVGSTGGGKSTIMSLLARFYEPTGGEILINGVDYRRRSLAWWQSQLGIVLQTPHLFTGTIRDNIRYGNLNADDERIAHAAEFAGAAKFIAQLPDGLDTDVGQGGNRLSVGQRQLVALARAILADPQVFIMDEATSSVDTETEHLIQQGIDQITVGRISFIIAHRLSTVQSADRILVIESGRIVEAGRHADLLQLRGRYFELFTQQFSGDVVNRISEATVS